jgi:hypothetical protein
LIRTKAVLAVAFILCVGVLHAKEITEIRVNGLERTRMAAVLAACGYAVGDDFSADGEKRIEANLWDLGIFRDIEVSSIDDPQGGTIVLVNLKENWTFYPYPIVFIEINGPGSMAGAGFWDSNFLGLAHRIRGSGTYSFSSRFVSAMDLYYYMRNSFRYLPDLEFAVGYSHYFRNSVPMETVNSYAGLLLAPFGNFRLSLSDNSSFRTVAVDAPGIENYFGVTASYSTLRAKSYLKDGYELTTRLLAFPYFGSAFHPEFRGTLTGLLYATFGESNLIGRFQAEGTNSGFFGKAMNPAHYIRGRDDFAIDGETGLQANAEYRFLIAKSPWIDFLLTDIAIMGTVFSDGALYWDGNFRSPDFAVGSGAGLRIFAYGLGTLVRLDFNIDVSGLISKKPLAESWRFTIGLEDLF